MHVVDEHQQRGDNLHYQDYQVRHAERRLRQAIKDQVAASEQQHPHADIHHAPEQIRDLRGKHGSGSAAL